MSLLTRTARPTSSSALGAHASWSDPMEWALVMRRRTKTHANIVRHSSRLVVEDLPGVGDEAKSTWRRRRAEPVGVHQLHQLAEGVGDGIAAERWVSLQAEKGVEIGLPKLVPLRGLVVDTEDGVVPVDATKEGIKNLGRTRKIEGLSYFALHKFLLGVVKHHICHRFKQEQDRTGGRTQEQEQELCNIKRVSFFWAKRVSQVRECPVTPLTPVTFAFCT